jgi:hypothetical protein
MWVGGRRENNVEGVDGWLTVDLAGLPPQPDVEAPGLGKA